MDSKVVRLRLVCCKRFSLRSAGPLDPYFRDKGSCQNSRLEIAG